MKSREGIKNEMILLFFNLVGPILLLSVEKRTERSKLMSMALGATSKVAVKFISLVN